MKLVDEKAIRGVIHRAGNTRFNRLLLDALEEDFSRWESFNLSARHATHYPHGVFELMPCSDKRLYAFKYVNGHPRNTTSGKLSVVAIGMLADVESGYPLMICDMTLPTALRTAATAALAARHLARPQSSRLAMIGCGAQSEFQAVALRGVLPLDSVRYYDPDQAAMRKFRTNMEDQFTMLHPCGGVDEAIRGADVIVTATADKRKNVLFASALITPGTHIHALGGDCPGKTELPPDLLGQAKIVVEFARQATIEGEIQNSPGVKIHAELWEIICGNKAGRCSDEEITLFDSVGFALEDFSVMRLLYEMSSEYDLGMEIGLIPQPVDPKNLYGLLSAP
ncbi:MAG: ornithine cyclodeaminase [Pseudomonadota bacterium]